MGDETQQGLSGGVTMSVERYWSDIRATLTISSEESRSVGALLYGDGPTDEEMQRIRYRHRPRVPGAWLY